MIETDSQKTDKKLHELSVQILRFGNSGVSRIAFLQELSAILFNSISCDAIELRFEDNEKAYIWEVNRDGISSSSLKGCTRKPNSINTFSGDAISGAILEIIHKDKNAALALKTSRGSYWINNTKGFLLHHLQSLDSLKSLSSGELKFSSYVVIFFDIDPQNEGILVLKNNIDNSEQEVDFAEDLAQTIGLAIADRRVQSALRERVKELTCLYGIAKIAEEVEKPIVERLQRIVNILPESWQFPEIAVARIDLDEKTFMSSRYRKGKFQQTVRIIINGQKRGSVEVAYLKGMPEFSENAFLNEEVELIHEVARQIALIVNRDETENERLVLQEQLLHADRLSTVGNLAAGVAHEINEPLGGILGFAQLAIKAPDLGLETKHDLDRIISSAIHAKEIVRKLLIFARQLPVEKRIINLNEVILDGILLLENRCHDSDVELVMNLDDGMPGLYADAVQIKQLLVNLVVNGIQAMPDGGQLAIRTYESEGDLVLKVIDSGIGMTKSSRDRIFNPFYTTKDVGKGTGLGLSVVHGIVIAHNGKIHVTSGIGQGTSFEVHFPLTEMPVLTEDDQDG